MRASTAATLSGQTSSPPGVVKGFDEDLRTGVGDGRLQMAGQITGCLSVPARAIRRCHETTCTNEQDEPPVLPPPTHQVSEQSMQADHGLEFSVSGNAYGMAKSNPVRPLPKTKGGCVY